METYPIIVKDLRKSYGSFEAVKGISFQVSPNTCYGFLGHNGAGKTTTMKMITGLAEVTSGYLEVLGTQITRLTPPTVKQRIGVVTQEDGLDDELSALENLSYFGLFYGLSQQEATRRGKELIEFMGIAVREDVHIDSLSGGLKRRLVIARALISNPELVILDEPTTGLDPAARRLVWQKLEELKKQGVTLLLTTHYMEEAAMLCDQIAVMSDGIILDEGSPAELIQRHATPQVLEIKMADLPPAFCECVAHLPGEWFSVSDRWFFYAEDTDEARKNLICAGLNPAYLVQRAGNLEDVYLKLAGKEAES